MTIEMLEADLGPGVRAGFTRRAGGFSAGRFEGLDLALHVGDDPDAVRANRELLAGWLGLEVAFASQVHGTDVLTVDAGTGAEPTPEPGPGPAADALVARGGRAVGVLVADCVPVLLADPVAAVVGAAHAGRRGLLAGVVQAAVQRMVQLGARPERMIAALGPAAGGCCYEVPEQMRDAAAGRLPALAATTTWGSAALDLRAGCRNVLEAAGVGTIRLVGGCTIEDPSWYSHRRQGVTGRFAGVVRMPA